MAIRKLCISKGCGLSNICELAQTRDSSHDVVQLWDAPENSTAGGGCLYYEARKELNTQGDLIKGNMSLNTILNGGVRHGAGKPGIGTKGSGDAYKKRNSGLIIPEHLKTPPDLGVSRHIKKGRNIKGD